MKRRLYSSAFCLIFCLACFRTCSVEPSWDIPPEYIAYNPKQLENDCKEYRIYSTVISNRPLRCYPQSHNSADEEKYVGNIVFLSSNIEPSFQGKEYIEIPTGTEIHLETFFVNANEWIYSKETPETENYFLKFYFPSKPSQIYSAVYFMGRNGTLKPLPWDSKSPIPPPGTFRPVDIERLFPGGEWFPAKQKDPPLQ